MWVTSNPRNIHEHSFANQFFSCPTLPKRASTAREWIPSQATGEFNKLWEPSADASNELLGEVGVISLDRGMVGFSNGFVKK